MKQRPEIDSILREYVESVLPVASSRARFVIEKLLKDGEIDSEDLRDEGYVHGARAIGDVRDNGIPLITSNTTSSTGRRIAKYVFGSSDDIKRHKFGGRVAFPATLKSELLNRYGPICALSHQELPEAELQIDHRIPYYISGDPIGDRTSDHFMLLSRQMQRSKSWSCEGCENILRHFDLNTCRTCYWASPENYDHIAMRHWGQFSHHSIHTRILTPWPDPYALSSPVRCTT